MKILDKIKNVLNRVPREDLTESLAFVICLSVVSLIDMSTPGPYQTDNAVIDTTMTACIWCGFFLMLSCREPTIKKFYLSVAAAAITDALIGAYFAFTAETLDNSNKWLAQTISTGLGLTALALIFAGVEASNENKTKQKKGK